MRGPSPHSLTLRVNTGLGKDHTVFATAEGKVTFNTRGPRGGKTFIDVLPA